MPCSGVTLDYQYRDSGTMPVTLSRNLVESDYRIKYSTSQSSSSGTGVSSSTNVSCSRRLSSTSPAVSDIVQKYSSRGSALGGRSSSLTEDLRDRSQTRESVSRSVPTSRSRTTSYSSDTISSSAKTYSRKPYTSFDLNEFRSVYSPNNYIAGTARSESTRPPRPVDSLSIRSRVTPTLVKEKKSETSDNSTLEVIAPDTKKKETSVIVNGESEKDKGDDVGEQANAAEVNSAVAKSELKSDDPPEGNELAESCTKVGESSDSSADSQNDTGSTSPRLIRSMPTGTTGRNKDFSSSINSTASTSNGLSGLRNIGNTCFLNSVVQCLSNTKALRELLINREFVGEIRNSETKGALIKSFSDVIAELWSGEGKIVNTASFKEKIQRYAPRFMGYNQQDAQEFLRYLLEGLHDDINRVAVKPRNLPEIDDNLSDSVKANETWKQYLRFDNSRIVDLFVGQLKSTLTCTSCGHSSTTFEVFWDLSLPLPTRSGTLRLQQCIDHFVKEEVLDGDEMPTCSKCKTRRKCTKRYNIQKFPKILVLHLKRFSPSERYRKLSANVEFPLTNLDMSGYSTTPQTSMYNLYAVSNHSGTAYSGHYTAYCLHSGTSQWYEFNDSRVSRISPSNVVSPEAYILFYEQTNSAVTTSRL